MTTNRASTAPAGFASEIKRILMIKSHSMGIGDLLRSSAAWRAMTTRWPGVELHLLFLSRHPAYVTEELIRAHHLLTSATFLTVRAGSPHGAKGRRTPHRVLLAQVRDVSRRVRPDWVIDFEPSGLRSTLVARCAARANRAQSVGIAQFPGRGLLYDLAAPSSAQYAQRHGLTLPMDYTHRDFVALAALGVERQGTPIELQLSPQGRQYQQELIGRLPVGLPLVGLNIGCGTPDAIHKRPAIAQLVECLGVARRDRPHNLVLSGAAFERDINQEFIAAYASRWGDASHILDLSGATSLTTLAGLIDLCQVFISTDSGPYHMSVALRKPTLVWFTYAEVTSFHEQPWCRRLIQPDADEFRATLGELMSPCLQAA